MLDLFTGYNSYISMLMVEHSHNHPVLRVFCKLLLDQSYGSNAGGHLDRCVEQCKGRLQEVTSKAVKSHYGSTSDVLPSILTCQGNQTQFSLYFIKESLMINPGNKKRTVLINDYI